MTATELYQQFADAGYEQGVCSIQCQLESLSELYEIVTSSIYINQ